MAGINRLTGGRVWASRLLVLGLLGALVGLVAIIAPALAAPGDPIPPESAQGVTPIEVPLGGQDNDCSASVVGLDDLYDFRIVEPNGTYTDTQSGSTVTFEVETYTVRGEEYMDFTVTGALIRGLVIKGGDNSAFYSYSPNVSDDSETHATLKTNGKLHQVSHASFCYETTVELSGLVYDDADFDGSFDATAGDTPEEGVQVTATSSDNTYQTVSDENGNYQFNLPAASYTVCEEARENRLQTEPTSGADCDPESFEALGYMRDLTSGPSSGNDFGTAAEICGQILDDNFTVFVDVYIEVFENGNGESACENKAGSIYEIDGVLHFPLVGDTDGEAAAIAILEKEFSDPEDFGPLQYSQDLDTDPFEIVPWCALRSVTPADGDQFEDYLDVDTMYPSLSGITDPDSGDESVACRVFVSENVEGTQVNVLLIQDDPRFR